MEKPIETAQVLLGMRIRSLRKAKKWTLEELGEEADTNHKHIGEVERGQQNPSFAVLVKIAGALGVELPELFRFEAEALDRKELEVAVARIVESLPDEDLGRMVSVLKVLYPLRFQ
jgi:transcriptional regulator with XRE-family HTH domain